MTPSVKITYFVHGTTFDNEKGISTGWLPGELSELGKKQSRELANAITEKKFDVVFCSDLKRAVDSAKLTFGNTVQIITDSRLRECNYGDLNGGEEKKVKQLMEQSINTPFPNGESYKQVEKRIREFVEFLRANYSRKSIAIVAHQAPQLALDVIVNGKTWREAIRDDWRRKTPKEWKPGWKYQYLTKNSNNRLSKLFGTFKSKVTTRTLIDEARAGGWHE